MNETREYQDATKEEELDCITVVFISKNGTKKSKIKLD